MHYALISSAIAVLIITIVSLFYLELKGKSAKARIILLGVLIVGVVLLALIYGEYRLFDYQFGQAFMQPVPMSDVVKMSKADENIIDSIVTYLSNNNDKKELINVLNKLRVKQQSFYTRNGNMFLIYNINEHANQFDKFAKEIKNKSDK